MMPKEIKDGIYYTGTKYPDVSVRIKFYYGPKLSKFVGIRAYMERFWYG